MNNDEECYRIMTFMNNNEQHFVKEKIMEEFMIINEEECIEIEKRNLLRVMTNLCRT